VRNGGIGDVPLSFNATLLYSEFSFTVIFRENADFRGRPGTSVTASATIARKRANFGA
jgi:hypothetical protein